MINSVEKFLRILILVLKFRFSFLKKIQLILEQILEQILNCKKNLICCRQLNAIKFCPNDIIVFENETKLKRTIFLFLKIT